MSELEFYEAFARVAEIKSLPPFGENELYDIEERAD